MKKKFYKSLSLVIALMMMINVGTISVSAENTSRWSESDYAPANIDENSSMYTPWFNLVHMTTATQESSNVVGGELCQQVKSIATSSSGDVVLVGTDTNGLWRSENGGDYWYNTGAFDFSGLYINDITFVPNSETDVYMISATSGSFYADEEYGLFKSTDGGLTWESVINENTAAKDVDGTMAFDAQNNLIVALNSGIYKVKEDETVTKLYDMSANQSTPSAVSVNGDVIIAGYSDGLYVSTDSGASFTKNSFFTNVYAADIIPGIGWFVSSEEKYYKSNDNGVTWSAVLSEPIRLAEVVAMQNGYRLYVTLNRSTDIIRYSDDYGNSWNYPEINRANTFDVNYEPYFRQGMDFTANGTGYISAGGIYKTTDNGTTFNWKSSGISGLNVVDTAIGSDGKLYFASIDVGTVVSDTPYTQKGEYPTFKIANKSVYGGNVDICINPDTNSLFKIIGTSIYKSTDGGVNYSVVKVLDEKATFISYSNGKVYTNEVFSSDDGSSWDYNELSIDAVSPIDSNIMWRVDYGETTDNVSYSSDGGLNWTEFVGSGYRSRMKIVPDVSDKNSAYLITHYGIVKYTAGKKVYAKTFAEGITSMAQNPANPNHIVLGTSNLATKKPAGLYETKNGGQTWYKVNSMPASRVISSLCFSEKTEEVFVMSCNGVFSYDYNKYAEYLATLSFAGGVGSMGSMDSQTYPVGHKLSIPECGFSKVGYEFAGWSDGTTTYEVGADYVMPDADTTLTAIWTATGTYKRTITVNETAHLVANSTTWNSTDHNYYSLDGNNVEANNGIGHLRHQFAEVYYKLDLSEFKNKSAESVKLHLYVGRNSTGNSTIKVRTIDSNWDINTVKGSDIVNQSKPETTVLDSITFQNSDASNSETYFAGSNKKWIELDITSLLDTLDESGYVVGLNVFALFGNVGGDGYLIYGPTTSYAPYITFEGIADALKLNFNGGKDVTGTMDSVSALAGNTVKLPECGFSRVGYEFAGWSDGTTTYEAGADYVMPDVDTTLTAIWTATGTYTKTITVNDAAHLVAYNTTWNNGTPHDYFTLDGNNVEANNGVGYLIDPYAEVFYKLDLSELKGKNVENAKLHLYIGRNSTGNAAINVRTFGTDWDSSKVKGSDLMTSNKPAADRLDSIKFQNSDASNSKTYFTGNNMKWIELDITAAINSLDKTENMLGLNVYGSGFSAMAGYLIYGPTTSYAPYITFEGIYDSFVVDGEMIDCVTASNITCQKAVIDNEGSIVNVYAALYRGGQLLNVVVSEPKTLQSNNEIVSVDFDLTKQELKTGDELKTFVWKKGTLEPVGAINSIYVK